MVSIVERREENQILHRISWLEGRGFRYLECSSILDVRTHLRNDMKKEKKDDDDNDGNDDVFFERGNITLRSNWNRLMLISFISPINFIWLSIDQ